MDTGAAVRLRPRSPRLRTPAATRSPCFIDGNAISSGLQLKDRDGTWLDVVGEPGTLIVDVGDMLARLTNDVLPSTTHQVVNTEEGRVKSRYSMPFFMHPQADVDLSCLPSCKGTGEKHTPITAGDFLMQRLREIGLIK